MCEINRNPLDNPTLEQYINDMNKHHDGLFNTFVTITKAGHFLNMRCDNCKAHTHYKIGETKVTKNGVIIE